MRTCFALVAAFALASVAHAQEYDCNDANAVRDCLLRNSGWDEQCFCEGDDAGPVPGSRSQEELRELLARALGIQDISTPAKPFKIGNIWAEDRYRYLFERNSNDTTLMGNSTAFSVPFGYSVP